MHRQDRIKPKPNRTTSSDGGLNHLREYLSEPLLEYSIQHHSLNPVGDDTVPKKYRLRKPEYSKITYSDEPKASGSEPGARTRDVTQLPKRSLTDKNKLPPNVGITKGRVKEKISSVTFPLDLLKSDDSGSRNKFKSNTRLWISVPKENTRPNCKKVTRKEDNNTDNKTEISEEITNESIPTENAFFEKDTPKKKKDVVCRLLTHPSVSNARLNLALELLRERKEVITGTCSYYPNLLPPIYKRPTAKLTPIKLHKCWYKFKALERTVAAIKTHLVGQNICDLRGLIAILICLCFHNLQDEICIFPYMPFQHIRHFFPNIYEFNTPMIVNNNGQKYQGAYSRHDTFMPHGGRGEQQICSRERRNWTIAEIPLNGTPKHPNVSIHYNGSVSSERHTSTSMLLQSSWLFYITKKHKTNYFSYHTAVCEQLLSCNPNSNRSGAYKKPSVETDFKGKARAFDPEIIAQDFTIVENILNYSAQLVFFTNREQYQFPGKNVEKFRYGEGTKSAMCFSCSATTSKAIDVVGGMGSNATYIIFTAENGRKFQPTSVFNIDNDSVYIRLFQPTRYHPQVHVIFVGRSCSNVCDFAKNRIISTFTMLTNNWCDEKIFRFDCGYVKVNEYKFSRQCRRHYSQNVHLYKLTTTRGIEEKRSLRISNTRFERTRGNETDVFRGEFNNFSHKMLSSKQNGRTAKDATATKLHLRDGEEGRQSNYGTINIGKIGGNRFNQGKYFPIFGTVPNFIRSGTTSLADEYIRRTFGFPRQPNSPSTNYEKTVTLPGHRGTGRHSSRLHELSDTRTNESRERNSASFTGIKIQSNSTYKNFEIAQYEFDTSQCTKILQCCEGIPQKIRKTYVDLFHEEYKYSRGFHYPHIGLFTDPFFYFPPLYKQYFDTSFGRENESFHWPKCKLLPDNRNYECSTIEPNTGFSIYYQVNQNLLSCNEGTPEESITSAPSTTHTTRYCYVHNVSKTFGFCSPLRYTFSPQSSRQNYPFFRMQNLPSSVSTCIFSMYQGNASKQAKPVSLQKYCEHKCQGQYGKRRIATAERKIICARHSPDLCGQNEWPANIPFTSKERGKKSHSNPWSCDKRADQHKNINYAEVKCIAKYAKKLQQVSETRYFDILLSHSKNWGLTERCEQGWLEIREYYEYGNKMPKSTEIGLKEGHRRSNKHAVPYHRCKQKSCFYDMVSKKTDVTCIEIYSLPRQNNHKKYNFKKSNITKNFKHETCGEAKTCRERQVHIREQYCRRWKRRLRCINFCDSKFVCSNSKSRSFHIVPAHTTVNVFKENWGRRRMLRKRIAQFMSGRKRRTIRKGCAFFQKFEYLEKNNYPSSKIRFIPTEKPKCHNALSKTQTSRRSGKNKVLFKSISNCRTSRKRRKDIIPVEHCKAQYKSKTCPLSSYRRRKKYHTEDRSQKRKSNMFKTTKCCSNTKATAKIAENNIMGQYLSKAGKIYPHTSRFNGFKLKASITATQPQFTFQINKDYTHWSIARSEEYCSRQPARPQTDPRLWLAYPETCHKAPTTSTSSPQSCSRYQEASNKIQRPVRKFTTSMSAAYDGTSYSKKPNGNIAGSKTQQTNLGLFTSLYGRPRWVLHIERDNRGQVAGQKLCHSYNKRRNDPIDALYKNEEPWRDPASRKMSSRTIQEEYCCIGFRNNLDAQIPRYGENKVREKRFPYTNNQSFLCFTNATEISVGNRYFERKLHLPSCFEIQSWPRTNETKYNFITEIKSSDTKFNTISISSQGGLCTNAAMPIDGTEARFESGVMSFPFCLPCPTQQKRSAITKCDNYTKNEFSTSSPNVKLSMHNKQFEKKSEARMSLHQWRTIPSSKQCWEGGICKTIENQNCQRRKPYKDCCWHPNLYTFECNKWEWLQYKCDEYTGRRRDKANIGVTTLQKLNTGVHTTSNICTRYSKTKRYEWKDYSNRKTEIQRTKTCCEGNKKCNAGNEEPGNCNTFSLFSAIRRIDNKQCKKQEYATEDPKLLKGRILFKKQTSNEKKNHVRSSHLKAQNRGEKPCNRIYETINLHQRNWQWSNSSTLLNIKQREAKYQMYRSLVSNRALSKKLSRTKLYCGPDEGKNTLIKCSLCQANSSPIISTQVFHHEANEKHSLISSTRDRTKLTINYKTHDYTIAVNVSFSASQLQVYVTTQCGVDRSHIFNYSHIYFNNSTVDHIGSFGEIYTRSSETIMKIILVLFAIYIYSEQVLQINNAVEINPGKECDRANHYQLNKSANRLTIGSKNVMRKESMHILKQSSVHLVGIETRLAKILQYLLSAIKTKNIRRNATVRSTSQGEPWVENITQLLLTSHSNCERAFSSVGKFKAKFLQFLGYRCGMRKTQRELGDGNHTEESKNFSNLDFINKSTTECGATSATKCDGTPPNDNAHLTNAFPSTSVSKITYPEQRNLYEMSLECRCPDCCPDTNDTRTTRQSYFALNSPTAVNDVYRSENNGRGKGSLPQKRASRIPILFHRSVDNKLSSSANSSFTNERIKTSFIFDLPPSSVRTYVEKMSESFLTDIQGDEKALELRLDSDFLPRRCVMPDATKLPCIGHRMIPTATFQTPECCSTSIEE